MRRGFPSQARAVASTAKPADRTDAVDRRRRDLSLLPFLLLDDRRACYLGFGEGGGCHLIPAGINRTAVVSALVPGRFPLLRGEPEIQVHAVRSAGFMPQKICDLSLALLLVGHLASFPRFPMSGKSSPLPRFAHSTVVRRFRRCRGATLRLPPRSVLDKMAAIQTGDVHLPTTRMAVP